MLKAEMIEKLNAQMNLEFFSSNLYLQMSAWCRDNAFEGAAKLFRKQATEEMTHMMRLFEYLDGVGSMPVLGVIDAPPSQFSTLAEVMKKAYAHEQHITKSVNMLVDAAISIKDYPTFNFLQWYVAEQHEEEKRFKAMIDRLLLAGNTGEGLFLVDNEFGTA